MATIISETSTHLTLLVVLPDDRSIVISIEKGSSVASAVMAGSGVVVQ